MWKDETGVEAFWGPRVDWPYGFPHHLGQLGYQVSKDSMRGKVLKNLLVF